MKGVVFREFIDFVEDAAGDAVLDTMIERAAPASGGAYAATGRYDWREMVDMVVALSDLTGTPVPDLVEVFGAHLFGRFVALYPEFFDDVCDSFDFLSRIEAQIHVEVLKLYPDAELPTIDTRRRGPDEMSVRYTSCRPFGNLAIGLIRGCGAHFGERLEVDHKPARDGLEITVRRLASLAA